MINIKTLPVEKRNWTEKRFLNKSSFSLKHFFSPFPVSSTEALKSMMSKPPDDDFPRPQKSQSLEATP